MTYPNILGPASGSKESVLAYAKAVGSSRLDQVTLFVNELFSLGAKAGFDPFMICAQSAHETGDPNTGQGWKSPIWVSRLNPGGIGVTDSVDFNYGFKSGVESAQAILVHHAAYVLGYLPDALKPYIKLDPRYQAVFDNGMAGKIKTWGDYSKKYGTEYAWASDQNYPDEVVAKAKLIRGYEVTTYKPVLVDRYLDVSQSGMAGVVRYYPNRKGDKPRSIYLHIQEGTNWGSWEYWHTVSASSTVLISRSGEIWRVVREKDAPWTNGDVCSATPKGKAVIAKYGADPNLYTLSIEVEGYPTNENPFGWLAWPKPQAQLDAIVWQVQEWMRLYSIPVDMIFKHSDINQCTRSFCPGDQLYQYVIAHVNSAVTTPVIQHFVKPQPVAINGVAWNGKTDVNVGGTTFHAFARKVSAKVAGACHLWADFESEETRKPLAKGETFGVLGWIIGEAKDGENRWWITKAGSRVWCGYTNEKPSKPATTSTPKENPFDRVINGVKFNAINKNGKPSTYKVTVPSLNVRKWAKGDAPLTRSALKLKDDFRAVYWVRGEAVSGNDVWLVTVNDSRIWSGGTNFKTV